MLQVAQLRASDFCAVTPTRSTSAHRYALQGSTKRRLDFFLRLRRHSLINCRLNPSLDVAHEHLHGFVAIVRYKGYSSPCHASRQPSASEDKEDHADDGPEQDGESRPAFDILSLFFFKVYRVPLCVGFKAPPAAVYLDVLGWGWKSDIWDGDGSSANHHRDSSEDQRKYEVGLFGQHCENGLG